MVPAPQNVAPAETVPPAGHVPRALWQDLEASRLLGVPFVPVAVAAEPSLPIDDAGTKMTGVSEAAETTLAGLEAEHDATCPLCTNATGITHTVFGEGNPDAELMFVGEAPGAAEDRTGRPFVGRAGQKLDAMIVAMGRRRADVYIANVLKSRPPDNRTPLPTEVAACAPFLTRQIRIIRPRVIVCLGGPATKLMLQTSVGITRLRGQWARYEDGDLQIDVMPTFHPAYLLRNYTRETREKVWSDLQAVMARLADDR